MREIELIEMKVDNGLASMIFEMIPNTYAQLKDKFACTFAVVKHDMGDSKIEPKFAILYNKQLISVVRDNDSAIKWMESAMWTEKIHVTIRCMGVTENLAAAYPDVVNDRQLETEDILLFFSCLEYLRELKV